jgi:hypothetical protein
MIPELHNGHPRDRALLEEIFQLLIDAGFEVWLAYMALVDIEVLAHRFRMLVAEEKPAVD